MFLAENDYAILEVFKYTIIMTDPSSIMILLTPNPETTRVITVEEYINNYKICAADRFYTNGKNSWREETFIPQVQRFPLHRSGNAVTLECNHPVELIQIDLTEVDTELTITFNDKDLITFRTGNAKYLLLRTVDQEDEYFGGMNIYLQGRPLERKLMNFSRIEVVRIYGLVSPSSEATALSYNMLRQDRNGLFGLAYSN